MELEWNWDLSCPVSTKGTEKAVMSSRQPTKCQGLGVDYVCNQAVQKTEQFDKGLVAPCNVYIDPPPSIVLRSGTKNIDTPYILYTQNLCHLSILIKCNLQLLSHYKKTCILPR